MRRSRKTKIVATLGPASHTKEQIRTLFIAGVDVFRINMSHTNHTNLTTLVNMVRAVEADVGRPIAILVDLQGPKLRLGKLEGGEKRLEAGQKITLVRAETAPDADHLPMPHPEIFAALKAGSVLLIDDGKVRLVAESVTDSRIDATVLTGGLVKNHKGVNLPDTLLPIPAMTPKDRSDLDYALSLNIDWLALSFVQRPDDVAELRKAAAGRAGVMTKLEKPAAFHALDEIISLSDSVMVARGDLGVELPLEAVPGRQKQIIRAARRAGKPVVVATQMLESMIHTPVPTRAEVSDVANAVFEGADAVMLSAETASGAYPAEAVAMMDRIAQSVENDPLYATIIAAQRQEPEHTIADGLLAAVRDVTHTIDAAAIVCWTKSGSTGLRAARERPEAPILALTPIKAMARRLTLAWGLHCVETEDAHDLDDVAERACQIAFTQGFAKPGERVVITAGLPLGTPGATNMLRVAFVTRKGL
ncbi:MAG TPA: pyruvate kinase [Micropepsaceae bacterium]|nr:pyruvate kinase [Micropepsaceae bacterium]